MSHKTEPVSAQHQAIDVFLLFHVWPWVENLNGHALRKVHELQRHSIDRSPPSVLRPLRANRAHLILHYQT